VRVATLIGWAQEVVAVECEGINWVFGKIVEFLLAKGGTISNKKTRLCMNSTKQSRWR
jgi:hypothetical protein